MPFTDSEKAILRHLYRQGDDVPRNIADTADYHVKSIQRTLSGLESDELVANKGQGVYRLTVAGLSAARKLDREDRETEN